jgi:monoamine oxidase
VPPAVLRRVAIEPKLPPTQAEAIATLPSQPLTQVYLAPRSRFWEQDGYAASLFTDTRAGMLAAARNRDDPREVTSLTAWITGDNAAALDGLSREDAGRAVVAAIETLRPAARDQLEVIGMHSWGADVHAGGAWAYFRPGEVTRFAPLLGLPHGRLHFCGEHLATTSRGMEGAMESAEECAAAILANG